MLPRFEEPTIKVSIFEVTDIITISVGDGGENDDTIEGQANALKGRFSDRCISICQDRNYTQEHSNCQQQ